tara:strand:+ start:877 stop:1182 length:306 start_codon:yes stop_codon:yes gene_type:complete
MNTFYKNVGLWMRMVRDSQSKKHTQTKVGNHLGVTFQQIQKYERGMNCIGLEKFYDVCKLYNISDNMIGDLLRQFKETPNAEEFVASPKILQVIDGGKYES